MWLYSGSNSDGKANRFLKGFPGRTNLEPELAAAQKQHFWLKKANNIISCTLMMKQMLCCLSLEREARFAAYIFT